MINQYSIALVTWYHLITVSNEIHIRGRITEMTVDPQHTHPNTITKPQKGHLPVHIKCPRSPMRGNTSKSPLMTGPQSTIALMNRTVI